MPAEVATARQRFEIFFPMHLKTSMEAYFRSSPTIRGPNCSAGWLPGQSSVVE
jgi:hypothetical protein